MTDTAPIETADTPALSGRWQSAGRKTRQEARDSRERAPNRLVDVTTIRDQFDSDGAGRDVTAHAGDELAFSVTGRFRGLVVLEQWTSGGPRRRLQLDAPAHGAFTVAPMEQTGRRRIHFRWRMDGHAAGTAVATLTTDLSLVTRA
jgi:hypothetical protein